MKITLFIPTATVEEERPSEWLAERLDEAIEYYRTNSQNSCTFVISGRWKNSTDTFTLTESEVAKRYICKKIPDAKIFKEDISVETGGNFAFSKPLIKITNPDRVIVFNSKVNENRVIFLAQKIFGPDFDCQFIFINDSFSQNPRAQNKEPKAIEMFKNLFSKIEDGDDESARSILLYETPFYFKGVIKDEEFFNQYWPGGFRDFLEKRLSIDNK